MLERFLLKKTLLTILLVKLPYSLPSQTKFTLKIKSKLKSLEKKKKC